MQRVIPVVLALLGAGAGLGAGQVLRSPSEAMQEPTDHVAPEGDHAAAKAEEQATDAHAANQGSHDEDPSGTDFVKLNNQFIVPVLKDGRVAAMVVLSLTLETAPGKKEDVYALEPKIRDGFLQVMFDFANAGGFDGTFTSSRALGHLRDALKETALGILGNTVIDVLVTDIARQDN